MVKDIKVFTSTTCGPCKQLKSYLKYKGQAFKEIIVDNDPTARAKAYELSGYAMVPVTVVEKSDGSQVVISGYNLNSLAKLI